MLLVSDIFSYVAVMSQVWETMMHIFDTTLSHAHKSKFTQFVIFFLCSRDPVKLCEDFTSHLLTIIHCDSKPAAIRSSCAGYLGSFLARAAFVPKGLVAHCCKELAEACENYIRDYDEQRAGCDHMLQTKDRVAQHQVRLLAVRFEYNTKTDNNRLCMFSYHCPR